MMVAATKKMGLSAYVILFHPAVQTSTIKKSVLGSSSSQRERPYWEFT